MSLVIRLKKLGAKGRPTYRLVVAEKRSKKEGKNIEEIGYYNPLVKPPEIKINKDRLEYWLKNGARQSRGVNKIVNK